MKADRPHNPAISAILDGVATLFFVVGAVMLLAVITKDYWICAIGASVILTGVVFVALGEIVRSLARPNDQRAHLLSQLQENAKALQWIVDELSRKK
jgi:hypothetical protein